ncbi:LOW QUALITY PROTEIN: hypothetical protein YC2023_094034 [Brassica napus]
MAKGSRAGMMTDRQTEQERDNEAQPQGGGLEETHSREPPQALQERGRERRKTKRNHLNQAGSRAIDDSLSKTRSTVSALNQEPPARHTTRTRDPRNTPTWNKPRRNLSSRSRPRNHFRQDTKERHAPPHQFAGITEERRAGRRADPRRRSHLLKSRAVKQREPPSKGKKNVRRNPTQKADHNLQPATTHPPRRVTRDQTSTGISLGLPPARAQTSRDDHISVGNQMGREGQKEDEIRVTRRSPPASKKARLAGSKRRPAKKRAFGEKVRGERNSKVLSYSERYRK